MSGRRRPLTPDEEDLWSLVVRTIRPLRTLPRKPAEAASEAPDGHKPPVANGATAKGRTATARKVARPPAAAKDAAARPPRPQGPPALQPIMRREVQKLARGHDTIDARIDLHGMTQSQAHAVLLNRLLRCQVEGGKFVLVITGKGRADGGEGRGVLRRQVPLWLGEPEFRRFVAGFEVARAGHGGEGALYVRLRKARVRR